MDEFPDVLRGEDFLFALLLATLIEACSTLEKDQLKSWHRAAYAHAMKELDGAGFIQIQSVDDNQIISTITPFGRALVDRLIKETGPLFA